MGKYRILTFVLFGFQLILAAALLFGQEQDPLIHRATNYKTVTGEVRLRASKAKIQFSQADRFSEPPTVWVQLLDSTTALNPDSLRAFAVGRLSPTGFRIRSLKFSGDTCLVRWIAIGR